MDVPGRFGGVFVALGACGMVAVGCATLEIGSYVDRRADVRQYRSYEWAATDRLSTGDPRLDNNPFFQDRLRAEIEAHLDRKEFERRQPGSSDLVVHYHASVSQQIDLGGLDSGFCDPGECQPYVYDAGTVVLDLVDARTNRLIWRGWAEGSFDQVIDDQQGMERAIDRAVARILDRLPTRLVSAETAPAGAL
jgi:hypothetical protein